MIDATVYANGSFSNGVHVNVTFPKSVHVNETFTINYSWSSDGTDIPDDDYYFTPRQMDIGNVYDLHYERTYGKYTHYAYAVGR